MMRRRYALGAAAAIVALTVVATASAMTPKQLYGKLLTTVVTRSAQRSLRASQVGDSGGFRCASHLW